MDDMDVAYAESSTSHQTFVRTRVIRIVLDGKPNSDPLTFRTFSAPIEAHRPDQSIVAHPKSTFGDISKELVSLPDSKVTVLEARLGLRPFWTISDHDSLIGDICRTIYALIDDPRPYILGVVRGPLSDYPVRICETCPSLRAATNPPHSRVTATRDRIPGDTSIATRSCGRD